MRGITNMLNIVTDFNISTIYKNVIVIKFSSMCLLVLFRKTVEIVFVAPRAVSSRLNNSAQ